MSAPEDEEETSGETAPAEAPEAAAEPKKKKKRKKKKKDDGEAESSYALPFARSWPKDPELARLVDAFERGNYAYVREHAAGVASRTADTKVRDAANDLRRRIDPDPVAGILLLVAVGLLIVLGAHYLGHRAESTAPASQQNRPGPHPTSS